MNISKYPFVMVPVATDVFHLISVQSQFISFNDIFIEDSLTFNAFLPALPRPPCLFFLIGSPKK